MATQLVRNLQRTWQKLSTLVTLVNGDAYLLEPEKASSVMVVSLPSAATPDASTEGHIVQGPWQVINTETVDIWIRAFPAAATVNAIVTPIAEVSGPGVAGDGRIGVTDAALDVALQDLTNPTLDIYFVKEEGTPTTLTSAAVKGQRALTVATSTGFAVGDYISVLASAAQGRIWFGEVAAVPNGVTLTLNVAIDFEFASGSEVYRLTRDLAVDGSATPVVFAIRGFGAVTLPLDVDITRLLFALICTNPPVFDSFGDIASGLTNGVLLRIIRATETRNLWFVKTNADLALLAYDVTFYDATFPQAVNGVSARLTYAGTDKHGAVIRLEAGDVLELVVYDNLSSLISFTVAMQGHIVI